MGNQVRAHEDYNQGYVEAIEWVRKTRINIEHYSDPHGDKQQTMEKEREIKKIVATVPEGKMT